MCMSLIYVHFACRLRYGRLQTVGLTLPDQYELVDNLAAYNRPWRTLPMEDIIINRTKEAKPDPMAVLGKSSKPYGGTA